MSREKNAKKVGGPASSLTLLQPLMPSLSALLCCPAIACQADPAEGDLTPSAPNSTPQLPSNPPAFACAYGLPLAPAYVLTPAPAYIFTLAPAPAHPPPPPRPRSPSTP